MEPKFKTVSIPVGTPSGIETAVNYLADVLDKAGYDPISHSVHQDDAYPNAGIVTFIGKIKEQPDV